MFMYLHLIHTPSVLVSIKGIPGFEDSLGSGSIKGIGKRVVGVVTAVKADNAKVTADIDGMELDWFMSHQPMGHRS